VTSDDSFRDGLRIGIGFALPGFVLAVSFGVLARDLGWGVVAPIVASIVVFSGSAQFAIANVLGAGGSAAAAIVAAVLVNARFAPMSVALASALKGGASAVPSRHSSTSTRHGRSRTGVMDRSTGN
jgi:predicted branched-subunit amino acid permease